MKPKWREEKKNLSKRSAPKQYELWGAHNQQKSGLPPPGVVWLNETWRRMDCKPPKTSSFCCLVRFLIMFEFIVNWWRFIASLIGAGESGKSTIVKQMKWVFWIARVDNPTIINTQPSLLSGSFTRVASRPRTSSSTDPSCTATRFSRWSQYYGRCQTLTSHSQITNAR